MNKSDPALEHDRICPVKKFPEHEASMYPGSGLGLCEWCGALLPIGPRDMPPGEVGVRSSLTVRHEETQQL